MYSPSVERALNLSRENIRRIHLIHLLGSMLMPSFPKIIDLPRILNTTDWEWTPYRTPSFPSYDFWLGIDPDGNRWLTKLKGDFYAYRELVFARWRRRWGGHVKVLPSYSLTPSLPSY